MIEVKKAKLLTADKKLKEFTNNQALLWDMLFQGKSPDRLVSKSDLERSKLEPFRPNLWSGEFIFDEDGNICDLEVHKVGEQLAKFYGQRSGQHVIEDHSDNSFRTDFPTFYGRFRHIIDEMMANRLPLLTISQYTENKKDEINVTGLAIPVSSDGEKIDMIFGYSEISVKRI